jgi:hypothetical protein
MNADLPTSSDAESTPHPDDPLVATDLEGFPSEHSSNDFPFLPPPIETVSSDVAELNLVFDLPPLREEQPRDPDGRGRRRLDALGAAPLAATADGTSWPSMLLLSYASAITLALVWVLWTGRRLSPTPEAFDDRRLAAPDLAPAADPLDLATAREPSLPLPPENLTSLGVPVRLGSVELTPLGVERRVLDLFRAVDPGDSRQTRVPVLVLRVRMRNISSDLTFAPLEPASVRELPGLRNETFVETDRGRFGMYPLALESEWALVGQEFPTLGPGESAETFLAASEIAEDRLGETLTWHARLRVAPHQTDVVGVKFARSEIDDE